MISDKDSFSKAASMAYNLATIIDIIHAKYWLDREKKCKDSMVNAFIYCENDNEQGHVYYGTYSVCVRRNGYTTKVMDDPEKNKLIVIERYYVD